MVYEDFAGFRTQVFDFIFLKLDGLAWPVTAHCRIPVSMVLASNGSRFRVEFNGWKRIVLSSMTHPEYENSWSSSKADRLRCRFR